MENSQLLLSKVKDGVQNPFSSVDNAIEAENKKEVMVLILKVLMFEMFGWHH